MKLNYKFSLVLLALSLFGYSQTPDFEVQHIQDDIPNTGGINNTITPVSSLNNAFLLANNNRKVSAGTPSNNLDKEGDDFAGSRVLTSTNSITYYRESNSYNADTRFNSSIWEYTGNLNGANEFIVIGQYSIILNGTQNSNTIDLSIDPSTLNSVIDANKCIPFITGILNNSPANDADSGTAIAYLEDATTLRIEKGSNDNNVQIFVTLVEFTGSNWSVYHADSANTGLDYGTLNLVSESIGSGTSASINNWNNAIIFGHHRGDNDSSGVNDAIADNWPVFKIGNNNQTVKWDFHSHHYSNGFNRHFVHVLENPYINVERFNSINSQEGEVAFDISSASLSDINQALIVGSSTSSGTSEGYGRGWRNYYLLNETTAAHWSHRSNNAMNHEIQIVDLSKLTTVLPFPEIEVFGNGLEITDQDTSPSFLDNTYYGTVSVGYDLIRTFTIENTGGTDLTISDITLSNTTDFSITSSYSSPVSSLDTTTFEITFNSVTSGTKTCDITISNNDINGNNFDGIGEESYTYRISAVANESFYDSDNDGVLDHLDIDDDNDGIPDSDEELDCKNSLISVSANYKYLNETFGFGNRTTINTTYDAQTTYCYEDGTVGTDTSDCGYLSSNSLNDGEYVVYSYIGDGDGTNDTPVEEIASWADDYWFTGEDHTPGDIDGRMAMFNASYDPGLFYSANIKGALPNVPITYSFWVLNLDTVLAPGIATRLRPNILVEFRDLNDNLLASITTGDIPPSDNSDPTNSWHNFSADLTFAVPEFNVFFYNNETGGLGNDLAIDDIVINQTLCDTDGDAVADVFDLDSDNDGIPDAVEAGFGNYTSGNATLTGATTWSDTNSNGMHDLLEGASYLDSDSDGTPNHIDLDSDNDSIFDVDESGAGNSTNSQFQNGDGDINGDGVGDGPDTDNARETDYESDGISEYFTDGILDIYDYFNGGTLATAYGNQNQGLGHTYYVVDSDNDGFPDFIDTDSDNDGTYDIENTLYSNLHNGSGVINDTNDSDGDGIVDLFDTDDASFGSPRDIIEKLSIYFDGRNDYIEDSSILGGLSNATLMGWIKVDPAGAGNQVLLGQNNFYIQLNSDKSVSAVANGVTITTSSTIATNRWTHIAATYSNSDSNFRLLINGQEESNNSISGNLNADSSNFTLGRKPNSDSNYYNGFFDEVRVFNSALSDNEIQKMVYQEIENNSVVRGSYIPRDISTVNWTNVLRYFRLDQYKGDITDDLTTSSIDTDSGAKLYNIKIFDYQSAPLPFISQQSGTLNASVNIPADGVYGLDAVTYDWSIVHIKHDDVTYNLNQGHLALIIDEEDASSNPIEYHVQNDSELNVSWYLKLDGFIDLEGESQLVQGNDSMLDETSKGRIERDQQGTADTFTYNYWSSPVGVSNDTSNNNNYTVVDILKDGTDENNPNTINFLTSGYNGTNTNPIGIADYWIWKYANLENGNYSLWQHVRSTGTILPGEGYTMKGPGSGSITANQNYVFNGKPNNGDISLTIDADNNYLVGNPYPSAISADEFINDNTDTNGTLYFWEHWGGGSHNIADYQGGYGIRNLSGGTPAPSHPDLLDQTGSGTKTPGAFIPVSQGFFVYCPGPASGTVNFENDQRVFEKDDATGDDSVFMKSSSNASTNTQYHDNRMKIRIGFDSFNGIHRQLLLTKDENASVNVDWGYDADHRGDQIDDMYWMINNKQFIIQGTNIVDTESVFPLGIKTQDNGNNSISIDQIENVPDNLEIYLYDSELNIYHDLRQSDYQVFLNSGENNSRFNIVFATPDTLDTVDNELSKVLQVFYNNDTENITILNPTLLELENFELFNILGQSVFLSNQIETENITEFSISNLSSGTYIINLYTSQAKISKKILVN